MKKKLEPKMQPKDMYCGLCGACFIISYVALALL
jgi:hypothetical protein